MLRTPADAPHSARPVGDERVLDVDVLAPIRDDLRYLTEYQNAPTTPEETLP